MSTDDDDEWSFMDSHVEQPQTVHFRMDSPVVSESEAESESARKRRRRRTREHTVPSGTFQRPTVHHAQLYQTGMAFMRPCTGVRMNFSDGTDDVEQEQESDQEQPAAAPKNNYTAEMVVRQLRYGDQTQWRPVPDEDVDQRYEARRRRFLEAGCINPDGSKKHCKRCDYMEPKEFAITAPTDEMVEVEKFIRQLHNYYLEHYNDSNMESVYFNYAYLWNKKLVDPFEKEGKISPAPRLTPVQVEYHFTECNKFYPVVFMQDIITDLNTLRLKLQARGLYTQQFSRGIAVGDQQVSPTNARLTLQIVNTQVRVFNAMSNMARNEQLSSGPDGFTGKSGHSMTLKHHNRKRKRIQR